MSQQRTLLFKTVVCGDGGVGKSTMIQRLLTGRFIAQKITIGVDLAIKNIKLKKDTLVKLQLWDFAGEKRFRFFLPNYSRGARGCLLCYDITRYQSFQSLKEWLEIVKSYSANKCVFILIGEKVDLVEKRTVNYEEGEDFRKTNGIDHFFETSSLNGENNQKIFNTLAQSIYDRFAQD